jgi:DNA repair protein RecO (recombination protein O)
MILQANAIVLRCIEYSNTSQIATLLTDTQGKVSVIAKGIHRTTKNGMQHPLGLLTNLSVVYFQARLGQLCVLKEHSIVDPYLGVRHQLGKIFIGLYWAELIHEFTGEGEPNVALFKIFEQGLRQLSQSESPLNLFFQVHGKILRAIGLFPHIERCVRCQKNIVDTNSAAPILFSSQRGGCLCLSCYSKSKDMIFKFSQNTWKKMLEILSETKKPISFTVREYQEMYSLFRFYLNFVLQKQMRMNRYMLEYNLLAGQLEKI